MLSFAHNSRWDERKRADTFKRTRSKDWRGQKFEKENIKDRETSWKHGTLKEIWTNNYARNLSS